MKIVFPDVEITGRVCDDDEIPVVEGIVLVTDFRDSRIDVHDLREWPQIVPVVIRKPGCHFPARNGTRRGIFIPRNSSARQKDAGTVDSAFLDIDVVLGAISGLSTGYRDPVPDIRLRFPFEHRRFKPLLDLRADNIFRKVPEPSHRT